MGDILLNSKVDLDILNKTSTLLGILTWSILNLFADMKMKLPDDLHFVFPEGVL